MAGGSPQVARRGVSDVVVAAEGMVQAGGLRAGGCPAHHAVGTACLVHHAGVGARTHHAGAGLCREAQGWSDPRDGHPLPTATSPPAGFGHHPGETQLPPSFCYRGQSRARGQRVLISPISDVPKAGAGRGQHPEHKGAHDLESPGSALARALPRRTSQGPAAAVERGAEPARRSGTWLGQRPHAGALAGKQQPLRPGWQLPCWPRREGRAGSPWTRPSTGTRAHGGGGSLHSRIRPCTGLCWAGWRLVHPHRPSTLLSFPDGLEDLASAAPNSHFLPHVSLRSPELNRQSLPERRAGKITIILLTALGRAGRIAALFTKEEKKGLDVCK